MAHVFGLGNRTTFTFRISRLGAGEVAQQLRVCADFVKDPSSVPRMFVFSGLRLPVAPALEGSEEPSICEHLHTRVYLHTHA